jgi:hypothetical protein
MGCYCSLIRLREWLSTGQTSALMGFQWEVVVVIGL